MLATAGRRAFLILSLIVAFTMNAGAQLLPAGGQLGPVIRSQTLPVIVQISASANMTAITSALGAVVIDNIPGTNTYLLNVPVPPFADASVLQKLGAALPGIDWLELNTGVTLPSFAVYGIVAAPTQPADWYRSQPAWHRIKAQDAQTYSTGSGIVIADINSWVDPNHPAIARHLTTSGYDFVTNRPPGSAALNQ